MLIIVVMVGGCGGDARMELAAGDALRVAADGMETALNEYHREVGRLDDGREAAVVDAFVVRVQTDPDNAAEVERHIAEFKAAMERIRADRSVQWQRQAAALDNVAVVREVAEGMQRLAMEGMTLNDELRRYLEGWLSRKQQAAEGGAQ